MRHLQNPNLLTDHEYFACDINDIPLSSNAKEGFLKIATTSINRMFQEDDSSEVFPVLNWEIGSLNIQYSFEKSCFSHKLFVTLSSVAVSRQKGRSRVNESFM